MTLREIARRRMYNQHVWDQLPTPEAVLGSLAAMQGQEFRIALWSVAQRAETTDESQMLHAFDKGTILRTHILRPTWHFVAAADIGWMLELSGPRVDALNASRYRQLGLDEKLLARTTKVIAKALGEGDHLTRRELSETIEGARIPTDGQRLAYMVMRAELEGVVCSGALRGKQHTYALLDNRAPKMKQPSRDEALAELTRRYFTSRGPATIRDFSRWSSLTLADCRAGVEAVQSELHEETLGDRTYWFAGRASRARQGKVVDLIQLYDELVMGYSDSRDALRAGDIPQRPWFATASTHAVLLDGQMIGRWKPIRTKGPVDIEVAPFRTLTGTEETALSAAADRYGRFVGVPVRLTMGRP